MPRLWWPMACCCPKPILDAPRLGCFNLHGSLLPRWRGAAPIQRAVMAGDAETGVMVMRMDEGLDTGPVLMAERVRIGRKTSGDLASELSRLGADLMVRALGALERGAVTAQPQSADGVTYAKKIMKDEARIDWSKSAARDRLPDPRPVALARRLDGSEGRAAEDALCEPVKDRGAPGEVITDELTIACGEGALRLLKVQRAGEGRDGSARIAERLCAAARHRLFLMRYRLTLEYDGGPFVGWQRQDNRPLGAGRAGRRDRKAVGRARHRHRRGPHRCRRACPGPGGAFRPGQGISRPTRCATR